MSSTCQSVAKCEDAINFIVEHTSMNDLISTIIKNFRILPKVGSDLLEEMVFCLLRPIIDNVSVPRYFLRRDLKHLFIWKGIMNWNERRLYKNPRKMVYYNIVRSLFIPYL
jgi:hypothetical protein